MEPWLVSTLIATALYGAMNFLFKVAAERKHDANGLLVFVGLSVALLAFATLRWQTPNPSEAVTQTVLFYALFNGLFFALGSLAKYASLKRAPAAIVLPVNRLNTLIVILIGFLFFHETPAPLQGLGILAGLGVLAAILWEQRAPVQTQTRPRALAGILFALGSALCTSLSMTAGKLLTHTPSNRIAYIAVSYSLVFLYALAQALALRRRLRFRLRARHLEMVAFGIAIGALNYIGYFFVLRAFGSGPISLSQAIFTSSIIVPIVLSRWFYRETLTPHRLAAIALAILSVVLMSA